MKKQQKLLSVLVATALFFFHFHTSAQDKKWEKNWKVFDEDNSKLPSNVVVAIAVGNDGIVWAGTHSDGLVRIDGMGAMKVYTEPEVPSKHINSMFSIGNEIWVGTGSGVLKIAGEKWTSYDKGIGHHDILEISMGPDSVLWAHAEIWPDNEDMHSDYAVLKLKDSTWSTFWTTVYSESGKNNCWGIGRLDALGVDNKGSLWLGGYCGFYKYDNGICNNVQEIKFKQNKKGFPSNSIGSIAFENEKIWVGTDYGIVLIDGKDTTVMKDFKLDVCSIAIDSNGTKWFGTYNNGLASYNGNKWIKYTTENSGLPDNNVYCLAFDKNGNLWMGTRKGVAVFNENGLK
jgi:ligand-binding sensor domain-containing protein